MSASSTPRRRPIYPESLANLHRFRKTAHGHDGSSRIVMVRKTDQRTFASKKMGEEPKLETVTRETIETFRGQKTEFKITTETKDTEEKCSKDILRGLKTPIRATPKKRSLKAMFTSDCLKEHNQYRAKHGVPPLKLSKQICKISQQWAEILIRKTLVQQSNNRDLGENVFVIQCNDPKYQLTAKEVVSNWYSEIEQHQFGVEPENLQSGHFTQVIWRDTQELGIGYAKLGGKFVVVANYDPPGNFIGQFAENVPQAIGTAEQNLESIAGNTTIISNPDNARKGVTDAFHEEFLDKHNQYRQLHGVPPLKLDRDLCKYSETWANYLADKNTLIHRPESNYGENIFAVTLSGSNSLIDGHEPVEHWYHDMKDYQFGREPKNLKNGGHFTQIIWKSSEFLGVGVARNNNRVFVVANYSPAGNFVGDYVQNVPRPLKDASKSPDVRFEDLSLNSDGTEGDFMQDFLEAHNCYRKRHNVEPLVLDRKMCEYSQLWADNLALLGTLDHNPKELYGENIYMVQSSDSTSTVSGYNPVDIWYEEVKYYDFNKEPKDEHSFHFTQLIWRNSKKLGVGEAKNEEGQFYVVANYDPPGNYEGAFLKNVLPPIDVDISAKHSQSVDFSLSDGTKSTSVSYFSACSDKERFCQETLRFHNVYRRKHGCPELVLNEQLCKYAQEWAETLAKKTSLTHRANSKYGENIFCLYSSDFSHSPSAKDTVKEWYDEVKFYTDYNTEAVNQRALHFSQVIWKGSRELGVGIAKNKRGQTFVVANYNPRGNVGGHFLQNVPKART